MLSLWLIGAPIALTTMVSPLRSSNRADRVGAYGLTLPAIALGLGVAVLLAKTGGRPFDAPPVALVAMVVAWAVFCVLAVLDARRSRRDRERRVVAEAASLQASRLSQLTAALGQARTPRAAIEAAVQEPLHALQADAGALLLVSRGDEHAKVARLVGYPEGEGPTALTLSSKSPIADAVDRGQPVILESSVAVPLAVGSRVVAVVQLEFHAPRVLSPDDRSYLAALAHVGAQALDRTWQLEVAERGRSAAETLRADADRELAERKVIEHALRTSETRYRALAARTSRLHALSAALSEAVTMEAVARAVITHGRVVAGAVAGEVLLLVDEGKHLETLYVEAEAGHEAGRGRIPVEDGFCATAAVKTGQPVFIRSLEEWQQDGWRSASVAADGGYHSSATMPLLVEGAPAGVLTFHFTAPVNFDEEYQALLVSVAQHCAQALDRARLYESTQHARADAERANRLKDEFVSIVSHELRTPLNAILGWTTMLQCRMLTPENTTRALQSVHDNASRQSKLIEELLDFSRVSSGRTSLQMEEVQVRELLRGVVESMIPTAVARQVDLRLSPVPAVVINADIRRLEQVCFNLIDNALKFTPAGGRVTIEVRIDGELVEIEVTDSGPGMDADFLPHVFDRFRQGDSTISRTHGGLGLGLSIAKTLVEAHGGRIAARSEGKGKGSTFMVQLPIPAGAPALAAVTPEPVEL